MGCINSIIAPKALAPIRTRINPNRPVRASGKVRTAKAMKWRSLSLPLGAGSGASSGQSIPAVRTAVKKAVSGMSRYLRTSSVYLRGLQSASLRLNIGYPRPASNRLAKRGLCFPDVEGCFSEADREEDIIRNAIKALLLYLDDEEQSHSHQVHEIASKPSVAQELASGSYLIAVPP